MSKRYTLDELMLERDIASMFNVAPAKVRGWVAKSHTGFSSFPAPVGRVGTFPVWSKREVSNWGKKEYSGMIKFILDI